MLERAYLQRQRRLGNAKARRCSGEVKLCRCSNEVAKMTKFQGILPSYRR
jgi:hypothetical protein